MGALSNLKRLYTRVSDPQLMRYQSARNAMKTAPFPIDMYRDCLIGFQELGLKFPEFVKSPKSQTANVYVRHDVDTQACIDNIERVMDIDKGLGVPSSVYFRVDDEDYDFSAYSDIVQRIAKDGFEVGLHTSCYSYDDPIKRFEYETQKFTSESGLAPTSFTLHGLGREHYVKRVKFRNHAGRNYEKFGYKFTDCLRATRHYRYVIEDCHVDPQTKDRFIYDDFTNFPDAMTKTGNLLVLTHPCYWQN